MTGRKLASIQQIAEIRSIEGADAIEAVRVNDWWCVAKKGEFAVNDLCVYHEIDCLLPMNDTYAFLAGRGTSKSELEDGTIVEGYRLKTIRLKGQLSQGLALPISAFPNYDVYAEYDDSGVNVTTLSMLGIGYDVTEILGIHKYERPMAPQLRGQARGNFPSFLRKSDQERCQNLRKEIWDAYMSGAEFQVTVKLDGSSMTVFGINEHTAEKYSTEARTGVCSRNLELKPTNDNAFWNMALQVFNAYDMSGSDFMFQGELVAPSIQGNFEGVTHPRFFIYNIWNIKEQGWCGPRDTLRFVNSLSRLEHVPVVHEKITLVDLFPDATEDTIIQKLLDYADGPSALGGKFREGLVYKRIDGKFSFKTISNKYLLKEKD